MELEEHLFRRESGRLVAILTRPFGVHNLSLAEDVVQDAFCRALETWKFHGVPRNPSAWLMTIAKQRALDVLRREGTARRFAPELQRQLDSEWTRASTVEEAFDAGGIEDVQLRMMFSASTRSCRWRRRSRSSCISSAASGWTRRRRPSSRTRRPWRSGWCAPRRSWPGPKRLFCLGGPTDVASRLPAVLRTLYLLFNEGYHGASAERAVRVELCEEALRLATLPLDNPLTARPAAHALAALFHFHAARLPTRVDASGDLILLADQDRSLWDAAHVAAGRRLLAQSAAGDELTAYHVEAAIAELHAAARRADETDWNGIAVLYETLMRIQPSPVVVLNRAVAIAQRDGPARGLDEIERIRDRERLREYPFYFIAIAEFELRLGRPEAARKSFTTALELARNPSERRFLRGRLRHCDPASTADA